MTLLSLMIALASCNDNDDTFDRRSHVKADVAFSMSGIAKRTRMADAVVQNNSARGITILHAIPIINDQPDALDLIDGHFVSKTNAQFYYASCDIPVGADKFRIYAKANEVEPAQGTTIKAHNGRLTATFPSEITKTTDLSSEISFSPVPIIGNSNSSTVTEGAEPLKNFLTNIANATVKVSGTDYTWKGSENPILKKLFQNFTNKGEAAIPGSAASVKEWANQLKAALSLQSFEDGSVEGALGDRIESLCSTTSISSVTYPRDLDLPDGAVMLRWNGNDAFVPQTGTVFGDNSSIVSSITSFAYPPELYYFVESNLKTANEPLKYETLYESTDISNWTDVLNNSKLTNNNVSEATQSIALVKPVDYAVAQLKVTIRTEAATVNDGMTPTANPVTIGTTYFPLTGIIVGGQRMVNDKFESGTGEPYFVFDSQVKTNGGDYYYLKQADSAPANGSNTLVFQNKDGENVTFILEFENKSTQSFYGVNGIVYPNTRFYLVGTINSPTYDSTKGDYTNRVFTKDYITTINVKVSSLAGAYNVLPNILSSNLVVGVETTPEWIAATPTTVILE